MQLLDEITSPECRAFAEAWQGWRGTDLVPRRSAVRIEEISKLLPYVSIVEMISEEVATIRLAGTALCQAMGVELTGLNYFELTDPETRALRVDRTRRIVAQPCGSHYLHPLAYQSGRTIPTEGLSLPVRPDDPSAPLQFFAIWAALEDMRLEGAAAEPRKVPIADCFQFVDIGAGVPDAGLNLTDRPPAALLVRQAG